MRRRVWIPLVVFGGFVIVGNLMPRPDPSAVSAVSVEAPATAPSPSPADLVAAAREVARQLLVENAPACASASKHISSTGQLFGELGKRTSTMADALPVIRATQEGLVADAGLASGAAKVKMLALADDYGRIRVALSDGDLVAFEGMVDGLLADINALDAPCGVTAPSAPAV